MAGTDVPALTQALEHVIATLREGAEAVEHLPQPAVRDAEGPYVVADLGLANDLAPPPREAWFAPTAEGRLDDEAGVEVVAAMLDQLPVVVTVWDTDLHLRYANHA